MRNMRIDPRPEGATLETTTVENGRTRTYVRGLRPVELIELARLAHIAAGVDEETAEDWAWMARSKVEDGETSQEAPYSGDGVIAGNE
jgi:hypothetical protein